MNPRLDCICVQMFLYLTLIKNNISLLGRWILRITWCNLYIIPYVFCEVIRLRFPHCVVEAFFVCKLRKTGVLVSILCMEVRISYQNLSSRFTRCKTCNLLVCFDRGHLSADTVFFFLFFFSCAMSFTTTPWRTL